jgi:hypothetical protein
MNSLFLAFTVVFPLFFNMSLGYGMRRLGLLDPHTLDVMNRLVFQMFLPVLLFINIYKTDLHRSVDLPLMAFAAISILLVFGILYVLVPRFEKEDCRRGVLIQGIFRSNFIIFGIPVAAAMFGDDRIGPVALLISVVVPLFNVLAVISLEIYREGTTEWSKILRGVAANPLILASIFSIAALLLGIRLPDFLYKAMEDLAKVTTPLALILLGGSFHFSATRQCWRQVLAGVTGRLVIVPLVFLPISILLGFRDVRLAGLLALYASPSAVSSFTMAKQMEGDSELAGQLVVYSSAFSILTMFLWIVVLKQGGFI